MNIYFSSDDYIELNNLLPGSLYNVIIESRKESKRISELVDGKYLKFFTDLF